MAEINTFRNFKDWLLILSSAAILTLVGNTWYNVNALMTNKAVQEAKEIENERWKVDIKSEINGLKTRQEEQEKKLDKALYYIKPEDVRRPKSTVIIE